MDFLKFSTTPTYMIMIHEGIEDVFDAKSLHPFTFIESDEQILWKFKKINMYSLNNDRTPCRQEKFYGVTKCALLKVD